MYTNDNRTYDLPEVEINQPIHQLPTATVTLKVYDLPEATVSPTALQAFYFGTVRPKLNKKLGLNVARTFDRQTRGKGREYTNQLIGNFNRLYHRAGAPQVYNYEGPMYYDLGEKAHGSEPYNTHGNIYNTSTYNDLTNQLNQMMNGRRSISARYPEDIRKRLYK